MPSHERPLVDVDFTFHGDKVAWRDDHDKAPSPEQLTSAAAALLKEGEEGLTISPAGTRYRVLLMLRHGELWIGRRMPDLAAAKARGRLASFTPAQSPHDPPCRFYAWTRYIPA